MSRAPSITSRRTAHGPYVPRRSRQFARYPILRNRTSGQGSSGAVEGHTTMYGVYRISPLGCVYYTLTGLTIALFIITALIFHDWQVETSGVWTTGHIISVSHCRNRSNQMLSTVQFTVAFTDTHGVHQVAQTGCEDNTLRAGQTIAVRYLPSDPGYILTRADIGGGQGLPLIGVLILDATLSAVVIVGGGLMVRAARRKRVAAAPAPLAAQAASAVRSPYRPWHGRLPRRLRHRNRY